MILDPCTQALIPVLLISHLLHPIAVRYCSRMFANFGKLAKALRPDVDVEELKNVPEKYPRYKQKRMEVLALWLAENESIIRGEKLDLSLIFEVLKLIDTLNPEYKAILNVLNKVFPFDVNIIEKNDG